MESVKINITDGTVIKDDKYNSEDLLYLPDWMIVLNELGKGAKYMRDLFLSTGFAYIHIYKLRKIFVKKGWLTANLIGRKYELKLTSLGQEIIENGNNFYKSLGFDINSLLKYRRIKKYKVLRGD